MGRSGVSAILRKGESCSANPTMRRLRVAEVWRYATAEVLFLDASCLAYGFDGRPRATVDYSDTRSPNGLAGGHHYAGGGVHGGRGRGGGGAPAIRHSGDVIDDAQREGKHTIDVNLRALSDEVGALYLTLSAWTTALAEIVRPEVRAPRSPRARPALAPHSPRAARAAARRRRPRRRMQP